MQQSQKTAVFTLRRAYLPHGTFGVLETPGIFINTEKFRTVEQPWRNNKTSVSCIPEGTYHLSSHHSPSKGDCLKITNKALAVDDIPTTGEAHRTYILMHIGNIADQSEGCVLVGTMFTAINHRWAVGNSEKAMRNLLDLVGRLEANGYDVYLTITQINKEDVYTLSEAF